MPGETPVRWARVLAVLLAAVVACEVAARITVRLWAGRPYQTLALYRWSPYGLVRNHPRATHPAFAINENGFRDVQTFSRRKAPGTLRVLVLGGSTMYSGIGGHTLPHTELVDSRSTMAQYLAAAIRRDSRFAGLNVEVINAAVNFNSIVEVQAGFAAEYVFWEPDVVIVGGSANNFFQFMPSGATQERSWGFQKPHAWHREFDRVANDRGFASLGERALLTLEDDLAAVALARKVVTKAMDTAFAKSSSMSQQLGFSNPDSAPASEQQQPPASWEEYDRYIHEYLGYAESMVVIARRHDQQIAFFWEHFLNHVQHIKPLTEAEAQLAELNRRPHDELSAQFVNRARQQVARFCAQQQITLLDPIDELKECRESIFIDSLHYTKAGNRFMAEFVFAQLQDTLEERARRIRRQHGPERSLQLAEKPDGSRGE